MFVLIGQAGQERENNTKLRPTYVDVENEDEKPHAKNLKGSEAEKNDVTQQNEKGKAKLAPRGMLTIIRVETEQLLI